MADENNCTAKFSTYNALAGTHAEKAAAFANWRQAEEESNRPNATEGAKRVAHNVHP